MKTIPLNIIGTNVSGDLGPLTIYTDRHGRKVAYPISPPKEAPTHAQWQHRQRFIAHQRAYMLLDAQEKAALEKGTTALSLCLTGQNLYISCGLRRDFQGYATIARQAGLTLPPLLDA